MNATSTFAERVAVVTGAGSGIGRATALAFVRSGANVLAVDRQTDALKKVAAADPRIMPLVADICAEDAAETIIGAAVERWQRVDVLVNNAGATALMPLGEVAAARIHALLDLNVVAPSLLVNAAVALLRSSRGSIVNISSTYGHRPLPGAAHYAAAKAALEQLTRSWALELAPDGVRVNAIAPGPTETDALTAAGLSPGMVARIKQEEADRIPLGRRGEPDELAEWVLRVADPSVTWLTGQVLTVDGGLELL
ncbi:ketoreductase [Spongiactinospora rosea]|uniref:Ketoreductase n=1 Tax=Spongiactinospora rosea TaxID=2248750 RepID=A0A366LFE3_9ACTN|nr:SDR family oxidoreductase [Spongiactinospora rosea]RBQ12193.1 ketoreductase [Spongiactinospora rosea]